MSTATKVCTTNRVGDKLVAHVTQTSGPGAGTIPAGSTVVLEVAEMQINNDHPEQSRIVFRGRGTATTWRDGTSGLEQFPAFRGRFEFVVGGF